ncbi:MAG: fructosamine kinase family protein [Nitrosomonadales bacterium]|nr:fructosamine kinase family protein [Nitrosomonadales bacterium]
MTNWEAVADSIGRATRTPFRFTRAFPLSGGCINQAWRIEDQNGARYFVKLNDARKLPMFEAECAGLAAIAATRTVRVPQPVTCGMCREHAYLVLEFLDLSGSGSGNERLLGEQLAALHRTQAQQFGFQQGNTLGEIPQSNVWSPDWITFWREHRLGYQLDLAARNGYGGKLQEMGRRLMERLPEFFGGYQPLPSLLHGDLWGGNHAYTTDGTPVVFDPAPYYGDREADLAMTELFGGFGPGFYAAYCTAWPLDAGYTARKELYNLYHVLNHANLFGGGYARQAEGMMQRLLAEAD